MNTEQALGLVHFIQNAGILDRAILVLLVVASVASWYLILSKSIRNVMAHRSSRRFLDVFWHASSLGTVAEYLEKHKHKDPFSRLTYQGLVARAHHDHHGVERVGDAGSAGDFLTRALRRMIDAETARAESGLTTLAAVGSTAPFVGLLGTVWAIYHALIGIARAGGGSLAAVAGPVGEALLMTAAGLAVAIPAVLGYNFLVRSNRMMLARLDGFAHDLFTFLATGAKLDGETEQANVARLREAEPAQAGQRPDDPGNQASGSDGSVINGEARGDHAVDSALARSGD